MPKRDLHESEIDHLSAHVTFKDGTIETAELHAKVRMAGMSGPTKNLSLENVRQDPYHFAFEYWCRDVRFMDPAGSIESRATWFSPNSRSTARLRASIERSRPITFGCSAPTENGLVPIAVPLVVRVGLMTAEGRRAKGSSAGVLSDPQAVRLGAFRLQSHLHRDIRRIDSSWPEGVILFIESGMVKKSPPTDYALSDVRGTSFEALAQGIESRTR
jgi:hypothetical protein